MLFELPNHIYSQYNSYENNGQSQLLQIIRSKLIESYPNTQIKGDGQVVVVDFGTQRIELLPAFKQVDNTYKHPDSNLGGSWKITNPKLGAGSGSQVYINLLGHKSIKTTEIYTHVNNSYLKKIVNPLDF